MSTDPTRDSNFLITLARTAAILPIVAWASQFGLAAFARQLPFEVHFAGAIVQCLLLLGGLILGMWSLAHRNGHRGIVLPSAIGIGLSGGTFLLILVAITTEL